ncbi:hypothetical protein E2C01_004234 [Portunus trituberculatus]|uniref:Uncharacterized protein n=1 Tax=Portunus trituberculatus TaxID=210409 RepID=A0A5B7CTH0_PORTR|nr:hypothetical protein [Portunus trituberculatus]
MCAAVGVEQAKYRRTGVLEKRREPEAMMSHHLGCGHQGERERGPGVSFTWTLWVRNWVSKDSIYFRYLSTSHTYHHAL